MASSAEKNAPQSVQLGVAFRLYTAVRSDSRFHTLATSTRVPGLAVASLLSPAWNCVVNCATGVMPKQRSPAPSITVT